MKKNKRFNSNNLTINFLTSTSIDNNNRYNEAVLYHNFNEKINMIFEIFKFTKDKNDLLLLYKFYFFNFILFNIEIYFKLSKNNIISNIYMGLIQSN